MPFKLVAPIEKICVLERSDAKYGNQGEPTTVTVRQATQEQHEKRAAVWSEVTQVMRADNENSEVRLRQKWTLEELKRMEVFLTMVGCNIEDEEGRALFRFRNDGKRQVLDMSDYQFSQAWGRLEPDVAQEIHQKVLEVNKTWAGPLGN